MSKTENAQKAAQTKAMSINDQIKELRNLQTNRDESLESLAEKIEPLAQAMATLSDKAKKYMSDMANNSKRQHKKLMEEMETTVVAWTEEREELSEAERQVLNASNRATAAARAMEKAGKSISKKLIFIVLILGLLLGTAAGVGSWHLLKRHYITTIVMEARWTEESKAAALDILLQR